MSLANALRFNYQVNVLNIFTKRPSTTCFASSYNKKNYLVTIFLTLAHKTAKTFISKKRSVHDWSFVIFRVLRKDII
jgi:hypothetical protein